MNSRDILERQIVIDARLGDTTVLASLLEQLSDEVIFNALSDENQTREPFAISISDGHDEDWVYFAKEMNARDTFNFLVIHESDIHLYKLNDNLEYEVIDSFWDEDK